MLVHLLFPLLLSRTSPAWIAGEKYDNVPAESIDIHTGEPDFDPGSNRATPECQIPLGFELGAIFDSGGWAEILNHTQREN